MAKYSQPSRIPHTAHWKAWVSTGDIAGDVPLTSPILHTPAGNITIVESALDASGEGAGTIQIHGGDVTVCGASTLFADNSGDTNALPHKGITMRANNLWISGGPTCITTDALVSGNACRIEVEVSGAMSVVNGGQVLSNTFAAGKAGAVKVNAATLVVDGTSSDGYASTIKASAADGSSGQTGSVIVSATEHITLSNGGELAIRNDATVTDPTLITPTLLSVAAPTITLKDASITAASSGNVTASDIRIDFSSQLFIDQSVISTSANLGNGGSIAIQGGNVVNLINSQITTSVLGLTGNGGNISLGAGALVMNTGFIQANTAALNAAGGTVGINVQNLVSSGSTLFAGGQTPLMFQPGVFGYNVIQAAAPTGRGGLPPSARGSLRAERNFPPSKNSNHAGMDADYLRVVLSNWGCG